jgi:hypothetical protein
MRRPELTNCNAPQALNTKLTPLVYLNSNKPSIADVSLYCEIHPEVVSLSVNRKYARL